MPFSTPVPECAIKVAPTGVQVNDPIHIANTVVLSLEALQPATIRWLEKQQEHVPDTANMREGSTAAEAKAAALNSNFLQAVEKLKDGAYESEQGVYEAEQDKPGVETSRLSAQQVKSDGESGGDKDGTKSKTPSGVPRQYKHVHDYFQAIGTPSLQDLQAAGPLAGNFKVLELLGGGTSMLDKYNQQVALANGESWVGPSLDGHHGPEALVESRESLQADPVTEVLKDPMSLLGQGAYGTVFKAVNNAGEFVAIKFPGGAGLGEPKLVPDALKVADITEAKVYGRISSSSPGNVDFLLAQLQGIVEELEGYAAIRAKPDYLDKGHSFILDIKGVLLEPGITQGKGSCDYPIPTSGWRTNSWQFETFDSYVASEWWKNGRAQWTNPTNTKIKGSCKGANLKALVLELGAGGSGEKAYSSDPTWTKDARLEVLRDFKKGLNWMHNNKLVHHDFKPANTVLVRNADGRWAAKLMDFGLVLEMGSTKDQSFPKGQGNPYTTKWISKEMAPPEVFEDWAVYDNKRNAKPNDLLPFTMRWTKEYDLYSLGIAWWWMGLRFDLQGSDHTKFLAVTEYTNYLNAGLVIRKPPRKEGAFTKCHRTFDAARQPQETKLNIVLFNDDVMQKQNVLFPDFASVKEDNEWWITVLNLLQCDPKPRGKSNMISTPSARVFYDVAIQKPPVKKFSYGKSQTRRISFRFNAIASYVTDDNQFNGEARGVLMEYFVPGDDDDVEPKGVVFFYEVPKLGAGGKIVFKVFKVKQGTHLDENNNPMDFWYFVDNEKYSWTPWFKDFDQAVQFLDWLVFKNKANDYLVFGA
eukprot:g10490.t1